MKQKSLYVLVAALAAFALSTTATAQADHCGYGIGGVYGAGVFGLYNSSPYASSRIPTPPYFALHPPVYYKGRPVARSYGYSPFPYPGTMQTPEPVEEVQAKMIINPHVQPAVDKKPQATDDDRVAEIVPEVIRNPFVAPLGTRVQMAAAKK